MRSSMDLLTRRAFLLLALVFATFRSGAAPPQAISASEFLLLSQRLTGRRKLDAKAAATYLAALLAVPENANALIRLAREKRSSQELAALERTILEWWYTGTYE